MEKNIYKVKDLYEGALLYAKELPLIRLEWQGSQCFFVFERRKECQELANRFWRGGLLVDAIEYATAIKKLKDRLFAQK